MVIELGWDPVVFRRNFLLEYLAQCASAIQFPNVRSDWDGDLTEGSYFFDSGTGDQFRVAWKGDRLALLAFCHESDRSPFVQDLADNDPKFQDSEFLYRRYLSEVPESLEPLFKQIATEPLLCATAGLWQEGGELFISEEVEDAVINGLWLLLRHSMNADEAMLGESQNWMDLYSLSQEQARANLELLGRAEKLPTVVVPAELDLIGTLGAPIDEFPGVGVEKARQMYAKAGFLWASD
jgi:hypothetical protein